PDLTDSQTLIRFTRGPSVTLWVAVGLLGSNRHAALLNAHLRCALPMVLPPGPFTLSALSWRHPAAVGEEVPGLGEVGVFGGLFPAIRRPALFRLPWRFVRCLVQSLPSDSTYGSQMSPASLMRVKTMLTMVRSAVSAELVWPSPF